MKLPKFIIRVCGRNFVVASKEGIGALTELMAEAIPVDTNLHLDPPEITLDYTDEPDIVEFLQAVRCKRIPPNVVWKQMAKSGEVQIVRPVEKAPKALKAPRAKALPPPSRMALPPPTPQLRLL